MMKVNSNTNTVKKLLLVVVGMFGFGFLLVPLYDVFCEITGLNGKTGGQVSYEAEKVTVDTSRWVTVQFIASNAQGMPWEFKPQVREVKVHPGELKNVEFFAKNPTDRTIIGRAVPSVSPFHVADYMRKTECFCFEEQILKAGEAVNMPLFFYIDQDIPEDVDKLTLAYALYDVTELSDTDVSVNDTGPSRMPQSDAAM